MLANPRKPEGLEQMSRTKNMSFVLPFHGNVLFKKEVACKNLNL